MTCLPGFTLQSTYTCYPCRYPCKKCSPSNLETCLSCYPNAFLKDSKCITCDSNSKCLTCSQTNTTQCLTCPYGFSMSNGICVAGCPNNCLSCTNASVCALCVDGYSLNSQGICLPCLSNCRECSSQANAVCLNCGQGFYLNINSVC